MFGGIRTVVLVAVTLAALTLPVAAVGVTPKWMWTPAQAQQQAQAASEQFQLPSGDGIWIVRDPADISGCRGVGKASQGRFGSFRCKAKMQTMNKIPFVAATKTLWFKVRRQGAGQVCASLTGLNGISAGCLNPSGTRVASVRRFDAWEAASHWAGGPWKESHPLAQGQQIRIGQGGLLAYGGGYFDYSWTIADMSTGEVVETHSLRMILTSAFTGAGNCLGAGCPPLPGIIITQTS